MSFFFKKDQSAGLNVSVAKKEKRPRPQVRVTVTPRDPLTPLNVDECIATYQLLDKAAEEGKRNYPAPSAQAPIGDERLVNQIFEEATSNFYKYASDVIAEKDSIFNKSATTARDDLEECLLLPEKFEQELSKAVSQNRATIDAEKAKFERASREFEIFQTKNNLLDRNAKKVTSAQRMLKFSLVCLCVVIEGVINAGLFATNLDGGWVAGLLQAMISSSINVLFSYICGYALIPYVNHVFLPKKIFGIFSVVFWACATFVIALAIAHYRDALQTEGNAAVIAVQTMLENPLGLTDMISWLLFAVTLLMGTFAMFDGYTMRDPYPGYAEATEKMDKARHRWSLYFSAVQDGFNKLRETYLDKLKITKQKAANELANMKAVAQDKQQTLKRYELAIASAPTTCNTLIQRMRSANSKYRTQPEPKYFSEDPDFSFAKEIETPSADKDEQTIREVEEEYRRIEQKSPELALEMLNANKRQAGVLDASKQKEMI
jgi:hypothetical protein